MMATLEESIGRYRLVAKVRETRAGTEYRAYDPDLRRDVALLLLEQRHAGPAHALAQLQHPNVIVVFDVGDDPRGTYVATELVEGTSLTTWLGERPHTWREIVAHFRQAGCGLAAAHSVGLVHGDFHTDHVTVGSDGRVRVGDFVGRGASAQDDVRSFCAALDSALTGAHRVPARLRSIVRRGASAPSMAVLLDELAWDPAHARNRLLLWGGAIAVTAAIALGAVVATRSSRVSRCTSAKPLLYNAWGPSQRVALSASFARLGQPWASPVHDTIEAILDRYTAQWVEMHQESCEATRVRRTQSPLVLDLRSECLGRHLDDLREVIDVLVHGDVDTLERGISIVAGLPSLDDCADVAALTAPVRPPSSAEARAAVDEMRRQLARGRALADAAKFEPASQIATDVVTHARALHYRPLEAEALLDLSNVLERQGKYSDAVVAATDATHAAQAGRHDHVAAQSLIALVWLTGVRERKYELAHDFAVQASAEIERLDQRTTLQGELARCLGATYANEGRLDDALAQESRYLAIVEKSDGVTAPTAGGVLVEIGEIYREEARYDEALAHYDRALKIFEAKWGAEHPTVAVPLNNMGLVSHRLGRDEEALAYHRRALAIFERSLGPNHPHVAEALTDIGVVLLGQGKAERAYEQFERALAIDTRVSGAESAEAAIDLVNMGDARRAAHDLGNALRDLQRAVEIAKTSVGEEDPILAEAYLSLGKALAESGAHAKAIVAFDRALAIWQRPDAELEAGAGEAFTALGASQLALGNRKAALESATRAVSLLEKATRDPRALPAARELLERAR